MNIHKSLTDIQTPPTQAISLSNNIDKLYSMNIHECLTDVQTPPTQAVSLSNVAQRKDAAWIQYVTNVYS